MTLESNEDWATLDRKAMIAETMPRRKLDVDDPHKFLLMRLSNMLSLGMILEAKALLLKELTKD